MGIQQLWIILAAIVSICRADMIVRVALKNGKEVQHFQKIAELHDLDLWSASKNMSEVDFPCSKMLMKKISSLFSTKVVVVDINKEIDNEMKENDLAQMNAWKSGAKSVTSYFAPYDKIIAWLSKLASVNSFVAVEDMGKTFENRDMKVIKIAASKPNKNKKPALYITGGIHAREWLGVATVVHMIDAIVKAKKKGDKRISDILDKFDFYFTPVLNPDGYEYTFTSKENRLWRKTKRMFKGCMGSDPNRNFDIKFGQKGVSKNPCHITYPGPRPFSESCTRNFRDFVQSDRMKNRIKLYYDVHAYSQMYFVPFAYDKTDTPSDDAELRRVASISKKALEKVNGRKYLLGTPGEILYDASGSSMDWMKAKANVKYAYAFEVYPDSRSERGFIAKTTDIEPSGREILEAVLTAAENLKL